MSAAADPTLTVRLAEQSDGHGLAELNFRCWSTLSEVSVRPEQPGPETTAFDERHHPHDVQVALLDGVLVGYIRLVPPTELPSNGHIRQIQGLAVDPSARRHGVGRALVAAAIERARQAGARRVTLRVLGHNAPARRLYTEMGFRTEGTAPEEFYLDGRYVDDMTMGLTL